MRTKDEHPGRNRHLLVPAVVIGGTLVVAAVLVAFSLRRAPLETYPPTTPFPVEVGDQRVDRLYTIDASGTARWAAFDFSRGSMVPLDDPDGWDIAFRRFNVMTNGGSGFSGRAGLVDLGVVAFDSVKEAPESGYAGSRTASDSTNAAAARWYDYGFTSHILEPKGNVYAVRTADGRYAKLRFESYYCPGARPGCFTFRYVYQGDGSRDVATPAAAPDAAGPETDPAG